MKRKIYVQPLIEIVNFTLDAEIAAFNVLSNGNEMDITTQFDGAWGGLWE